MSKQQEFASLLSASGAASIFESRFSDYLDKNDPISAYRQQFAIPMRKAVGCASSHRADEPCIYLSGNSLGLMPLRVPRLVDEELRAWANLGVVGHFDHPHDRPWKNIGDIVVKTLATICGARQAEVACMGTLTTNIHTLMGSFYRPTKARFKILYEEKAFPSDIYAFYTQAQMHGLDPNEVLLPVSPRKGEYTLRTEDIVSMIKQHGSSIAVILFSGIQYYTGQCFDMATITKAGHEQGCLVGFDLAHAIGNVPLKLHDWNVDFAAWCSYKYLNAGPGAIAGIFVHEKHADPVARSRLGGWWGHNSATRFEMPSKFDPMHGAAGFQQSNPSVLAVIALHGSLQVLQDALSGDGAKKLRSKSDLLTSYLEKLLQATEHYIPLENAHEYNGPPAYTIITPSQPHARGAQLSLLFLPSGKEIMEKISQSLSEHGIVADERKPDVLRLAPVPLYNTFSEVRESASALFAALAKCRKQIG